MLIQKLIRKETAVESAAIIMSFIMVEKVIQTFRGMIFARMLGPTEYGIYSLVFFFIPLMVTCARLGIPTCYGRYVPQYEKKGMMSDFFKKNYLVTIIASIFLVFILLLFSKYLSELIFLTAEYEMLIIIGVLTVIPYVMYENFVASFNSLKIFKMGVIMRFSQFLIFTVVSVAFIYFYPKAKTLISASLASYVFVSSVFGYIFWKYILNSNTQQKMIEEDDFYQKMIKYSIWLVALPVIDQLFRYTDRLMLNKFLGLEKVGIYSIGITVSNIVLVFGIFVDKVLIPHMSRIWENQGKDRVIALLNLSIKLNATFLFFMATIVTLFKGKIVLIFFGPLYVESIPIINILVINSVLTGIYWTVFTYTGMIEKTYIAFISGTIGFILNLILNYMLIPIFQMQGSAMATTISFTVCSIILFGWIWMEGFRLEAATILVCVIPVGFLFGNIVIGAISLALVAMSIGTDLIFKKNEKKLLLELFKKAVSNYRINREQGSR